MILNNAVIERMMIDNKTYTSTKEFIDALLACNDLIADVYVNNKLVTSGLLNLSVNNNWIIGNVDERLSLENLSSADFIRILVRQIGYTYDDVEHIIMSTSSPLSTFIDPGDVDADLYFSIMSVVPECTQRCFVPDSVFRMMGSSNITPKDFSDDEQCPSDPTVVPDTPIVIIYTKGPNPSVTFEVFESDGETHYGDGKGELSLTWNFKVGGVPIGGKFDSEYSMYDPQSEELWNAIDAGGEVIVTLTDNIESVTFEDIVATLE